MWHCELSQDIFKNDVMKATSQESPGLFKFLHAPQFTTTSYRYPCAVFINQGLTSTDVTLYYWDVESRIQCTEKIVRESMSIAHATKFATRLLELVPRGRYAQTGWKKAIQEEVDAARDEEFNAKYAAFVSSNSIRRD